MTARNLAVVLTPSLIRMKSRSKLMTEEELRALPRQTALVEHLICHAATIGVMTSRMFHGSLRLLEDMSSKLKAKKRKKNGVFPVLVSFFIHLYICVLVCVILE